MPFPECKVYSDGSHYIAIPHTKRPYKPRRKYAEEIITVNESDALSDTENASALPAEKHIAEQTRDSNETQRLPCDSTQRKVTKKELFNELYANCMDMPRREHRMSLIEQLRPYFKDEEKTALFVDMNLARKRRNLICRRIRLTRKANLQEFNYFVTFTYDGKIHTEESFRRKLKSTLGHFCTRKGWRYIGVWERSPEKKRLHFHGVFYIPEGSMPGDMFEKNDYNLNTRRRQITVQNTYFNKHFGRCDFEKIEDKARIGDAMAYIMKYIEKSGERIVYSRRLPQYFISDVMDEDVITTVGMEENKLLLYDDFKCWDEGVLVGEVSADTIAKLRKSN